MEQSQTFVSLLLFSHIDSIRFNSRPDQDGTLSALIPTTESHQHKLPRLELASSRIELPRSRSLSNSSIDLSEHSLDVD